MKPKTAESKLVDKLWKKYGDGMLPSKTFFRAAIIKAMQAEREACAKVCDANVSAEFATRKVDHQEMGWTQACAIQIRARGEK